MANELLRVNSQQFKKAAADLQKSSPKILRALKKELRAEAVPLGKQVTAGLADGSAYAGGLGSKLRGSANYTKLVFRRDGQTVSMNLVDGSSPRVR